MYISRRFLVYLDFFYIHFDRIFYSVSSAAHQISLCRRMLGLNPGTIAILQIYCETVALIEELIPQHIHGKTPTQISHFRQIPSADIHMESDNYNFDLFFMSTSLPLALVSTFCSGCNLIGGYRVNPPFNP